MADTDNALIEDIVSWVQDNHKHHSGAPGIAFTFDDTTWHKKGTPIEDSSGCYDGEYPYVNSIELLKFIKKRQDGRSTKT